jgi:hypothetical protein
MFLIRRLTAPPPEPDASPASEFDRHLAPSIWQPHTRADYWWAWRLVAMFLAGTGRRPVDVAATLKALTWDLSAVLCRRRR